MSKKKRTIIIICLIIVLYAASKFRIAEAGDKHILILHIGESASWTTYPVTIHTDCGDIHLKAFTDVAYSGGINGYINFISNKRRDIKHNLVFKGNHLNEDITSISLNGTEINGFGSNNTPQQFVIDEVAFSIKSFHTNYRDNYVYFLVLDFEKIILQDNIVITPGSTVTDCIFRQKNDQWELYHTYSNDYFIATNPAWDTEKRLTVIIFETGFGKVLSYEKAEEW